MISNNRSRTFGIVGMASAVLWIIALLIEFRYGLQPPGNGSFLYYADQTLFFFGLAAYFVMLLGMWQSKGAGDGIFGKISLGIFIIGMGSLVIASIVLMLTNNADFFLFPVGGIGQLLGGLLTGIAVATSKRWGGWQRFAPLLQGLCFLIADFFPLVILNQSSNLLGESLSQVTWFITSLALFTTTSQAVVRMKAAA